MKKVLHKNVKLRMATLGLDSGTVCFGLGISYQRWRHIREASNPNLSTLMLLALVMGVPVHMLLVEGTDMVTYPAPPKGWLSEVAVFVSNRAECPAWEDFAQSKGYPVQRGMP